MSSCATSVSLSVNFLAGRITGTIYNNTNSSDPQQLGLTVSLEFTRSSDNLHPGFPGLLLVHAVLPETWGTARSWRTRVVGFGVLLCWGLPLMWGLAGSMRTTTT